MTLGGNLQIGSDAGGGDHFLGSLDDIHIYNRALSTTEVSQLYNIGRATIKR
jgi:hypothetical protein